MMGNMLQDTHDDSISSKRVITFISFILCCIGYLANLFFKYTVDPNLYNSLMYIVIAGMGFTGLEKFASNPNSNTNKTTPTQ